MSAAGRVARSWFTSRSVAKAVGGEVLQGGPTGRGVATDTRADCDGMVLYAGFIDGGTTRGLPDEDEDGRQTGSGPDRRGIDLATQIAASTREVNRKGIYPDYSSARYIAIDDDEANAWRSSGFTVVHVMPSGELMNGTTTVVALVDVDETAMRDSILQADFGAAAGWRSDLRGLPCRRTSLPDSCAGTR